LNALRWDSIELNMVLSFETIFDCSNERRVVRFRG
jgi:hypothetical protein